MLFLTTWPQLYGVLVTNQQKNKNMNEKKIPSEIWVEKAKNHANLVGPYADSFVERRSLGFKHPIYDFLFTYYTCSPAKLKQWVPSLEDCLFFPEDLRDEYFWFNNDWFFIKENFLFLNTQKINESLLGLAKFIEELCQNISQRSYRFGCFGLHEWAMVYKLPNHAIRHNAHPLRLSMEEISQFVESQAICCTHYDAFRFFTEDAVPLNQFTPSLKNRLKLEQGGCLHVNMDLYKWATKLWPWIGSDFIAKTFLLALKGRELDMRASPYDFKHLGYEPIQVETHEGRKQYQKEQQDYAEESALLRKELLNFCQKLIGE